MIPMMMMMLMMTMTTTTEHIPINRGLCLDNFLVYPMSKVELRAELLTKKI
jgi:hypothetical protein